MAATAGDGLQKAAVAVDRQLGGHMGLSAPAEPQLIPEQHPGFSSDRMVHWPYESKQ